MRMITEVSRRHLRTSVLALLVVGVLFAAGVSVRTAGPKFYADDPIAKVPESGRRVEGRAVGHRPLLRPHLQPVRDAEEGADTAEGAERQYDRRGPGFQLVHQPHRVADAHRERVGRMGRCTARCPNRPRGRSRGRRARGPRPASPPRTRKARRISCPSTPRRILRAPPGPSSWPRRLFWALGYNQVEYLRHPDAPRQDPDLTAGDAQAAVGRPYADDQGRRARDPGTGQPQRRRHATARRRAACSPGKVAGRVQVPGHAPRRPQRPRAARASPRTAGVARVRGVDEPHRHEGGQHARHRRERGRAKHRAPLPAGRGLDLRCRRQRAARLERRLGVPLRRGARRSAGSSPSASG